MRGDRVVAWNSLLAKIPNEDLREAFFREAPKGRFPEKRF